MVNQPDALALAASLRNAVRSGEIAIDPNHIEWHSGVYAVVDCVFSSQAKYDSMVLPILRQRLPKRLPDHSDLRFTDFLDDIDAFGTDKWDRYAREVMANLQVLSGRRKVEVCYDIAQFFAAMGLERKNDLLALPATELDSLIRGRLRQEIRGIGEALARYLLILLGQEAQIKPDVMILRYFASVTGWKPRVSNRADADAIQEVIAEVAADVGTTPARLDNAIWQYQRRLK